MKYLKIYEEVITNRSCNGAKYCQSVYIAERIDEKLVICNLQLVGAALSAWIDFRKKTKVFDGAIVIEEQKEGKKGKTVYQIPVFRKIEVTPESDEEAKSLDKQLQDYLTIYFKKTGEAIAASHVEEKVEPLEDQRPRKPVDVNDPLGVGDPPPEEKDDLPF